MGTARKIFGYISIAILSGSSATAEIKNHPMSNCIEDAMLVFDASGSMSGIDAYSPGSSVTRIDDARSALRRSLPHVTPQRRLGLITYGPGGHCHFTLNLRPSFNAAPQIMAELTGISPDGRTPLTSSIAEAANVLDYRNRAAVIVLLTDGAETCGGEPCKLAKALTATAKAIVIHVVGYRMKDVIESNERNIDDMKCLAAATGGRFIGANSIDELIDALNSTLGCPVLTQADSPFSGLPQNTSKTTLEHRSSSLEKIQIEHLNLTSLNP